MRKMKIAIIAQGHSYEVIKQVDSMINEEKFDNDDIVIVDNYSCDGLAQWLTQHSNLNYIICDEQVEPCGKILNTVIEEFVNDEDLLLLSPGIIIDKKNLESLCTCISKNESIAAVNGTNKSCDNDACEKQVLFMSDGVLLIKNTFLDEISFDEKIWGIQSSLLDCSLRGIEENFRYYQVVCEWQSSNCNHVEQNYICAELKKVDLNRIKEKWGMNYFNQKPNVNLLSKIKRKPTEEFSVLEVGCDCGANLLWIKNNFPNAKLCGLEINKMASSVARSVTTVIEGDINRLENYFEEQFDYIIFGDVLEHLHNPDEIIRKCKSFLTAEGKIIASIPNLMYYSVMKALLDGMFTYADTGLLDRSHVHFFTYYEIVNMFSKEGYSIEEVNSLLDQNISAEDRALISALVNLSNKSSEFMYTTFQYIFVVSVNNNDVDMEQFT